MSLYGNRLPSPFRPSPEPGEKARVVACSAKASLRARRPLQQVPRGWALEPCTGCGSPPIQNVGGAAGECTGGERGLREWRLKQVDPREPRCGVHRERGATRPQLEEPHWCFKEETSPKRSGSRRGGAHRRNKMCENWWYIYSMRKPEGLPIKPPSDPRGALLPNDDHKHTRV